MLVLHIQLDFVVAKVLKLSIHQCQQATGLSQNPRSRCKHKVAESSGMLQTPTSSPMIARKCRSLYADGGAAMTGADQI